MLLEGSRLRLQRLLGLWDVLVDPRVGVINQIYELPLDDDDPNFFHMLSTSCDSSRFTPLRNFGNNGGVSTDSRVAVAKAMGEAIERYCSALFLYDELIFARYQELDQPATPPQDYALYRPQQTDVPWSPFRADSLVAWTRGRSLLSREEILVPASMVYVPYHYMKGRGDAAIVQPISTGLAAGSSSVEAIVSGLCEVIERDAFTITWQARISPPVIDPATLPPSVKDLLGRYHAVGLDVKLMDITLDVRIPTVLTIVLSDAATSPAVAVAAATDPSAEVAAIKSLEELAHTRKFAKQLMDYTPPVPVEDGHARVQDQRDHLRFYCPQESKRFVEFLWSSRERRSFSELADHPGLDAEQALELVIGQLAAAGLHPISCDLTTPDIAPLGLRVVRAVVPGMNPLFMGYRNRALGGQRLRTVPRKLGRAGLDPERGDNPYPHPFP